MKLRCRKNKDGSRTFFIDMYHGGQRRRVRLKDISDREAAEVAFADFRIRFSREQADLPTDDGMTLKQCLDNFIESKRGEGCKDSHVSVLRARADQALAFMGKDRLVRNVHERIVNDWRQYLQKPRRKGKAALKADTADTINRKVGLLKAALDHAVSQMKIGRNPIANIKPLSDDRREVWRMLSEQEAGALLGVLHDGVEVEIKPRNRKGYKQVLGKDAELYALVLILLSTGARLGEALAVRWQDVDFERGMVALHTTKRASKGRRAMARYVPMNGPLRELLEGLPKDGEQALTISRNNIRRKFDNACELAGIGHCRIHDLRHTFASHLVMAGKDLNTVRELLGHSTLTMTLRYAHLAPEQKKNAVEALPFGGRAGGANVVDVSG
jgi:integrase